MIELRHPTLDGVSVQVPRDRVKDWKRSGWVAPRKARAPRVSNPSPKTTPASAD